MDEPNQNINNINKESVKHKSDKNKKIGDYIIKHTIGKGTFGKVKIGEHIPTKENVAIKILEKSKINDKEEMIRIEREMRIIKSRFNHLNIVKIFEVNFFNKKNLNFSINYFYNDKLIKINYRFINFIII